MEQRTEQWFEARIGKFTASSVADLMATTKSGVSASRKNIIMKVRLTGQREEGYTNDAMQWGILQEAAARQAYSALVGELVDECGFILHPKLECFGASPDGLIGTKLVEIKCPQTATHVEYMTERRIPGKYQLQMLAQMACTGAEVCDFVSFDPRLPEPLQLCVIPFERDDNRIQEIEAEVIKADAEVHSIMNRLLNRLIEKEA
jgi:putative phage-type endonuclease